jgi:predicted DCC family thiol-disulfide oxidoreductase YuxK
MKSERAVPHYLLYDDRCTFCQRFRDWVVRRDRFKRIEPVGFHDPRLPHIAPGLTGERLFKSMHLVLPEGTIVSGHRAMPKILELLPAWAWLGRLLRILPGSEWLSGKVYTWIATHRR